MTKLAWRWWLNVFLYWSHVFSILFFSSFFYLSRFNLPSYLRKLWMFSIYRVYKCQDCKQCVDAGITTLMSISDGLGPSISCQKMEKARPMRKGMDGKVVCLRPGSAFQLSLISNVSNFPYLYLDLACKW